MELKDMRNLLLITLLTALIGVSTNTVAATQYVSDVLRIDMRTGPSNEFRIISLLKSGTAVNIISEPADSPWVEVETGSGDSKKKGWVRKQYLVSVPIARERLKKAEEQLSLLTSQRGKQSESIQILNNELNQLKSEHSVLLKEKSQLDKKYSDLKKISNNAVELNHRNRSLLEERELLKLKVEELTLANTKLEHDQYVDGITHGGIAVVLGAILAIVLTNFNFKKKRNEW
jgi:SH3 domain protein